MSISSEPKNGKSLVVILPWLGATPSLVENYLTLYPSYAYETYVYYVTLKDFIWPKSGFRSSLTILDEIESRVQDFEKIIIHAFSVGCYFYSIMIWQMRRRHQEYSGIWDRITAQIFDSPVLGSTSEMAVGVSKMIAGESFMATLYKNLCLFYFAMTKSHTVAYYDDLIKEIKFHLPNVPVLLLASAEYPMMIPQAFEDYCAAVEKYTPVTCKIWKNSTHVQHLRFHPTEYKELVHTICILSQP